MREVANEEKGVGVGDKNRVWGWGWDTLQREWVLVPSRGRAGRSFPW